MYPILFHINFLNLFHWDVRTYGAFMALGFAGGLWLSLKLNRKEGRPDEGLLDLAAWIMAGSVAGARLLYVAVRPGEFKSDPLEALFVWHGGLVYYGGLLGGALTAVWWIRRHRLPLWSLADCLAPGIALGQVFGRLGCFFNGCCYGRVDTAHGLVFPAVEDNLPHLPTQLYEAGACLALAGLLVWRKPHRRFVGETFWLYVLGYACLRFALEFWRGDAERGILFSSLLSPSQWISLAGAALAAAFLFKGRQAQVQV
jgi:phosphatidylglycerol:prolipoprotein diacylglycerol transferase